MDVQSVRDQLSADPKVIMVVSEWASDIYQVTTPECLLAVWQKAADRASERASKTDELEIDSEDLIFEA